MSLPAESIKVGKCYLFMVEWEERVRLVVRLLPDGRVQFEDREAGARVFIWRPGVASLRDFASRASREVPCDWIPDAGDL